MRRALHLAIDRPALVDSLLRGQGRAASQPAPADVFGFDPALPEPRYDPEAARGLLREAGWARGLKARLDVASDRSDAARLIASQLSRVGVALEINAVPRDVVYQLGSSGKSALYFMGWNFVSGESSEFLEYCLHSPGTKLGLTNYGGYANQRLDRIAEENPSVLDPLERQKLLFEAARIAMAELPVLLRIAAPTDAPDDARP